MRAAGVTAWLMAAIMVSACGVMGNPRPGSASHSGSGVSSAPAASSPPNGDDTRPPTQDDPPGAPDMMPPAADSSPPNIPPPDCVPPAPKAKPQPKPKPPHKPTPALPSGPPAAAQAPPEAIVGSQVKASPAPLMSILGTKVQGPQGEDFGRVVDVLTDASGRIRIAVIDFGGFLGVGDRRIAVEWSLLRFNLGGPASVTLGIDREKLRSVPEYKGGDRPQVLMGMPAQSSATPAASLAGDAKR